ncbi:MAG: spore maturation protein [Candidatus Reconcilbacillus cellulovorans]|uniref:Spore maturation protein n=1 Tax=Candidatus Reconcilbacillus cellulovorans TaxID=1906605 RepID=A0A2A6E026_9BACL|nr:MAG: spore maturation protein [Candidatus Reconcilbacillus cellulovorans]
MYDTVAALSGWLVPIVVVSVPLYAALRGVAVYESFVEGARDGFDTAVRLIPHLVGMMAAIAVFRASGALDLLLDWIRPALDKVGVPAETAPLALLRPLTGSGSLAFVVELMRQHGADSLVARIASTVQGSTETTLYVITVYLGAVGIRNGRYALKVGLMSDVVGFFASVWICRWVFGPT